MTIPRAAACELCAQEGGEVIARTARLRVVQVEDAAFPGFFRVIWQAHVPEFSDLSQADRAHCMDVVALVERAMRLHLAPTKINLASLGNVVPHLHWHLIARYDDDSHFPHPIWGERQRAVNAWSCQRVQHNLPRVVADIKAALP
jgi:diadenosine tetraphosphate (Ap4A) HIT family hydrolase